MSNSQVKIVSFIPRRYLGRRKGSW